jgi:hypothetical protein
MMSATWAPAVMAPTRTRTKVCSQLLSRSPSATVPNFTWAPTPGLFLFDPGSQPRDRPQLRFETRTSAARNTTCRHPRVPNQAAEGGAKVSCVRPHKSNCHGSMNIHSASFLGDFRNGPKQF